jgi:hypothetical protein
MKYSLLVIAFLSVTSLLADEPSANSNITVICPGGGCQADEAKRADATQNLDMGYAMPAEANAKEPLLQQGAQVRVSVIGQGVAPMNTSSPAQAYALAKRAATADAYRLLAEKIKGVRIDGQDLVKNMMVQRSTVRTTVQAMVKNANVVETTFKEGLCEVEMEIVMSHSQFLN